MTHSEVRPISRRRMLGGLGAAAGGAGLLRATPAAASAPTRIHGGAVADRASIGPVISSPPKVGVSYVFASWLDLTVENKLSDGRQFSAGGATIETGSDYLGATFDLPPGALLYDLEVYSTNTSDTPVVMSAWVSGTGSLLNEVAAYTVPANASGDVHASLFRVATASAGPFPHGTKLVVDMLSQGVFGAALNGFRIGYKKGPLAPVFLGAPLRAYDSRDHAPITAGGTVSIALAPHVPIGTNGAMYTVNVLNTNGSGALQAGADGAPAPATAVQWARTGDRATNSVTTPVSQSRKIEISSAAGSGITDFYVDVTGYLV